MGHRFPMQKYVLLPEQLLHEGSCSSANFFEPSLPPDEDFTTIHEPVCFDNLKQLNLLPAEIRKIGFPLGKHLVEREAQ